jgi:hypothetical protein
MWSRVRSSASWAASAPSSTSRDDSFSWDDSFDDSPETSAGCPLQVVPND